MCFHGGELAGGLCGKADCGSSAFASRMAATDEMEKELRSQESEVRMPKRGQHDFDAKRLIPVDPVI